MLVELVIGLIIIGIIIWIIKQFPIDPMIRNIIYGIIAIIVVLWLASAFGLYDAGHLLRR